MSKSFNDSSANQNITPPANGLQSADSTASLLLNVVRRLASRPDHATVQCRSSNGITTILLSVDPNDIGRVIGEDGRTARSLRSVVDALAASAGDRFELAIGATDRKPIKATP